MAVYTDGVHLIGDTVEELHVFAERNGIKRCWFENHRHPHYDLIGKSVEAALKGGAVLKSSKELVVINQKNKKPAKRLKSRRKAA